MKQFDFKRFCWMLKNHLCVTRNTWLGVFGVYTLVLFLAILLPLAPDDFLCYFSGLTSMPARRFTWIILLGKPWCILFYSVLFSYLI